MQQIYQNAVEVLIFIGDGRRHRTLHSDLKRPPSTSIYRLKGDERDHPFCRSIREAYHSGSSRGIVSWDETAVLAIGMVRLLFGGDKDGDSATDNPNDYMQEVCTDLMEVKADIRGKLFEKLKEFVVAPWWSRIWVVQEIAVSTAATVQFGAISVPWPVLVGASKVISDCMDVRTTIEPENTKVLVLLASQVSNIERTRSRWHADGGIDLVRLLQEFSNRQASDDRDKVYAILSLASPGHHVVPEYGGDVLKTYRVTALSLLNSGTGLRCWAGDQKRKNHKTLPSWIPDWSTAFDPADMRRMALDRYKVANTAWQLHIVDEEYDYWRLVAEQARQLLDCLKSRAAWSGSARQLPQHFRDPLRQYIDLLKERIQDVQFQPSITYDYSPSLRTAPKPTASRFSVEDGKLTQKKKVQTSISDLILICECLAELCEGTDYNPECKGLLRLFKHSYSFHIDDYDKGWAIFMAKSRWNFDTALVPDFWRRLFDPYYQFRSIRDDPENIFALQSILKGSVCTVGSRMFGWSNLEAALPILAQWLLMGLGSDHLADTLTSMVLGGSTPGLQMMTRAMVGHNDMRAEDYQQTAEWLSNFVEAHPPPPAFQPYS
ncbi:hypothetical protein N0V82_004135 [Gnomoniopsis sp. IMI 355080]|nr:hypothetical protein N0V82_004135 [Gnomoniopsis sp. IMI 355080]